MLKHINRRGEGAYDETERRGKTGNGRIRHTTNIITHSILRFYKYTKHIIIFQKRFTFYYGTVVCRFRLDVKKFRFQNCAECAATVWKGENLIMWAKLSFYTQWSSIHWFFTLCLLPFRLSFFINFFPSPFHFFLLFQNSLCHKNTHTHAYKMLCLRAVFEKAKLKFT